MDTEIETFFDENAGVASVTELAALIDESEGRVRAWARENPDEVRRLGATFCYTREAAELMLQDFAEEDLEEAEDEEE